MAGSNRRATPPRSRRGTRARPASRATAGTAAASAGTARKRRFFDYPRSGYHGLHRWLPSWRFVLGTFLTFFFLCLGGAVAAYNSVKVPDANDENKAQTTTVYYAADPGDPDGKGEVMGTFSMQNRKLVGYDTLPPYVGQAVAAAEDKTFFTNSGVDPVGMARALYINITQGKKQGGSTLTQQYVERYYFSTTTDYVGKAREAILAVKLGRELDKEQILERYLNTIYFGRNTYGIQTAAQAYFHKDAAALTVEESALLAGIIPSPNKWDPAVAPDKAEARWNIVLDAMVEMGWVKQADRAAMVFPQWFPYERTNDKVGPNGLLLQMVRDELQQKPLALSDEKIDRGGYQVYTTIQKPLQDQAVATATAFRTGTLEGMDGATPNARTKISISSVDPLTGGIVALYGGPNDETDQINRAAWDKIQGGSTFKPFTLIGALEDGISLTTRYDGQSPQRFPEWEGGTKDVKNFGLGKGGQFGNIDLVDATADSVNTVYAQLNIEIGAAKTAEVAERAGISTTIDPANVSNVLGTDIVHPLDMASAYATIANQGRHIPAHIVAKVDNWEGSTAFTFDTGGEQAFASDVMADTAFAMQQVVEKGSGKDWVKPLGRPIAGKTGTTQENKASWFVGFTPNIATAVSMSQVGEDGKSQETIQAFGKDKRGRTIEYITGGTWPSFLWAAYMGQAFTLPQYADVLEFPARANVGGKPTPTPTVSESPTEAPVEEAPPAPANVSVPNVEGKLEADATATLDAAGLTIAVVNESSDTVTTGRVIRMEPKAGAEVPAGTAITIVVSTGPKPQPTQPPATQPPAPQPTATAGAGAGGAGAGAGAGGGNGG